VAIEFAVMVSGAWPVLVIVTSTAFWAAGVPAATVGKFVGRPSTAGWIDGPIGSRFVNDVSASVIVPPSCSWW